MPNNSNFFLNSEVDNILGQENPTWGKVAEYSDFPYNDYFRMLTEYIRFEGWYTGDNLSETTASSTGEQVDLYPVRVNPIKPAVHKHGQALFGQITEDDRPLVIPKTAPIFSFEELDEATSKKRFDRLDQILHYVWYISNGRAIQMESGLASQVYGGTAFVVRWVTSKNIMSPLPIKVESIPVKQFYAIPDPNNPFLCKKAWIVKFITPAEARYYGVHDKNNDGVQPLLWLEEWDNNNYSVKINGKIATEEIGGGQRVSYAGRNPFKFVPFVYIPHYRIGGFWGESLIDGLEGLVKEMNSRVADVGDAISADSHSVIWYRNTVGNYPMMQKFGAGQSFFNLGTNPAISGNPAQPGMGSASTKSASETMVKYTEILYNQFRRQAFVPAVSEGEDEGSQRSALTLATRFWPLVSHILMERIFWTAGMNTLNMLILRVLNSKNGFNPKFDIDDEDLFVKMSQIWNPILPKDREAEVNEAITRMTNKLGSPQHLMEMLGDVDDPEKEVRLMLEFQKQLEDIETEGAVEVAKAQAEVMLAKQSSQQNGSTGAGKTTPPDKKTK